MLHRILKPFSFRGKARLLHKLCPRQGIREATVFGFRMSLDLQNYIERSIYLHVFEPTETSLIRSYLKPGMTVVDVGANVGYYSLMASSIVGESGHVYAFEPSPYALGKLREAVKRNKISNITVIESALGDHEGIANIYLSESLHNHTPSMVQQDTRPTIIPITTLDRFLGDRCVDLLKIDVEGFEPNVIQGAQNAINEQRIKAVLCEFNGYWLERNYSSSRALFSIFQGFGFHPRGAKFQPYVNIQNLLLVR